MARVGGRPDYGNPDDSLTLRSEYERIKEELAKANEELKKTKAELEKAKENFADTEPSLISTNQTPSFWNRFRF